MLNSVFLCVSVSIVVNLIISLVPSSASCNGCVELDFITFDRLIPKFNYTLVKFDIAFPYGEKHIAYESFAETAVKPTDDLLVALVGLKDYGDRENRPLAIRYKVDEKNLPEIFLFKNGNASRYVKFPEDYAVTEQSLSDFVSQNSKLFIAPEGVLKGFDEYVLNFVRQAKPEQKKLIEKVTQIVNSFTNEEDITKGNYYLKFFDKVMDGGEHFCEVEKKRLRRLLSSQASMEKMIQIQQKLNILRTFRVNEEKPSEHFRYYEL